MSKEFGAAVAQHLGHLNEAHNFNAGAAVDLPGAVKESAHSRLIHEQQEARQLSLQRIMIRLADMRERRRKMEAWIMQSTIDGTSARGTCH